MSSIFENKVIKKKKLGKDCNLQISKNEATSRIFVDFISEDGKLKLQRNFQDTFLGNKEAEEFAKTIKSLDDLRAYFKLPKLTPVRTKKK